MGYDYQILLPGVPVSSSRGALGWCSVVLIQGERRNLIFDTGSHGDRQHLLAALASHGLSPGDIHTVFLSHFHYDHVLNADLFPNARLLISPAEWDYVKSNAFHQANDPYVPTGFIAWAGQRVEVFDQPGSYFRAWPRCPFPATRRGFAVFF
ncbi:MAG: MBL fold metallo-hydrolase [Desulfobacteraceae bacterium]|nr:MAG: MBL fold metallo-hydrolase [Desulfobacteraceae bacterium]